MSEKQKLIILPGWGGNEILWQHQCQHLKDIVDPEVIVITHQDTIEKMAEDIVARAPDKFILLGHSLGGWVAQFIAINYPSKVIKLILLATWTGASTHEFIHFLKHALQRIKNNEAGPLLDEIRPSLIFSERRNEGALLKQIKLSQSQFPPEGLINQTLAELNSNDTAPFLHRIQCPTLIIHGRQDSFFTLQEQEAIRKKIPHAKLTIVEECGHMLSIERPQVITALIRLWLQI